MAETMGDLAAIEKKKYERMWDVEPYRFRSPGLAATEIFLSFFHNLLQVGQHVTDFGCGTGRASAHFFKKGLQCQLVDIAPNCLDSEVRALQILHGFSFHTASLWDLPETIVPTEWIFCCDVLEHLPKEHVEGALASMASRCLAGGFLQIYTQDEPFGSLIEEQLHLTIEPITYWIRAIRHHFDVLKVVEVTQGVRYSIFVTPKRAYDHTCQ